MEERIFFIFTCNGNFQIHVHNAFFEFCFLLCSFSIDLCISIILIQSINKINFVTLMQKKHKFVSELLWGNVALNP